MGEGDEDFVSWLSTKAEKELSACIGKVGTESLKIDALREIRSLMDLLKEKESQIKTFHYGALTKEKWILWLDILEKNNLAFPEVLPDKNAIPAMIETIDANDAGGEITKSIVSTLNIWGQKSHYKAASSKLNAWLLNPNRNPGRDSAYELLIKCYLKSDGEVKKEIKDALSHQHFIQRTDNEEIDKTPSLMALYAIIYKEGVLEAPLPAKIKNFFETKPETSLSDGIVRVLSENDSYATMWHLARSEKNAFAISVIRGSDDSMLFSQEDGILYIDEYGWANGSDLDEICRKLISNNALDKAKDAYTEEPELFLKCFEVLSVHGGEHGADFVNKILATLKAGTWEKSLKDGFKLFELIQGKGNHEFKDGILGFALEDIAKKSASSHFWNHLRKIYEKLPDKEDVLIEITKKYFELDCDSFEASAFDEFIEAISSETLSNVTQEQVMKRADLWLRKGEWERLDWLTRQNVPFGNPSEALTSRLTAAKESDDGAHSDTIDKLVSLYGVEISKAEPEPDAKPD